MLYYDWVDVFEGIDVNKTSEWSEGDICHYWHYLDKEFKFQPDGCNGCHDVLMMSTNICNIAILNIHGVDYCIIISGITKSKATNLIQNINFTEKSWTF